MFRKFTEWYEFSILYVNQVYVLVLLQDRVSYKMAIAARTASKCCAGSKSKCSGICFREVESKLHSWNYRPLV